VRFRPRRGKRGAVHWRGKGGAVRSSKKEKSPYKCIAPGSGNILEGRRALDANVEGRRSAGVRGNFIAWRGRSVDAEREKKEDSFIASKGREGGDLSFIFFTEKRENNR